MKTRLLILSVAVILFSGISIDISAQANQEIIGAGATFPYPLYSKMFFEYNKITGIRINYQSIGSGGGIKQLQNNTVDFGASDAPLSDEEMAKMPAPVVHIPTCLGAVVISYNLNLKGNQKLKLTPEVIADIFLGNIKKWNDSKIKAINPGINLPDLGISVIHRSDGSGTTYVFSDYLSKVNSIWKNKPGKGKALDWPTGIGAKGNEGVGGMLKQISGSIAYLELAYAIQNKLQTAEIKNKSGAFIDATINSISAAANVPLTADLRISLTNTEAKDGYPISSFTYVLVYLNQGFNNKSFEKGKQTVKLINWMITDGQKYASPLMYAPLPKEAADAAQKLLKTVKHNGKALLQ